MANYKETSIIGAQWQRCRAIEINNPYKGSATITMHEEVVADLGGDTYTKPNNGMHFAFDPTEAIPLLDPTTDMPTGVTMTGMEIYAALYSLYIKRATERDNNLMINFPPVATAPPPAAPAPAAPAPV